MELARDIKRNATRLASPHNLARALFELSLVNPPFVRKVSARLVGDVPAKGIE